MPNVWVDTSDLVDEVLEELSDADLIEELNDRGYTAIKGELDINSLDELRKDYHAYGFTDKFRKLLEEFFEEIG